MGSTYCTTDLVNAYLYGVDINALTKAGASKDFLIAQFMPIAAADMDRFMRQTLNQETLDDVRLDGSGALNMVIPNWPLVQVTACTIYYGIGAQLYQFQKVFHKSSRLLGLPPDPTSPDYDLIVDRDKGIISINPSSLKLVQMQGGLSPLWNWVFTEGVSNIAVSYSHGFAAVPQDVAAAQAMYTAILIGEMAAGRPSGGASSLKIGTVTRTWANQAYASLFSTWWNIINNVLAHYQVREAEF